MALIYALLAVSITTLESTYMPRPLGSMWSWAQRLAKFEQGVEDSNVLFKSQSHLVRKLIAIPITEDFAGRFVDAMRELILVSPLKILQSEPIAYEDTIQRQVLFSCLTRAGYI